MNAGFILFLAVILSIIVGVVAGPYEGGGTFALIVLAAVLNHLEDIATSLKRLETHFKWQQRIEEHRFRSEYPDSLDVLKSEQQKAREQRERAAAAAALKAEQDAQAAEELKRKRAELTYRATEVMPEMPSDFQVPSSAAVRRRKAQ